MLVRGCKTGVSRGREVGKWSRSVYCYQHIVLAFHLTEVLQAR